ncbi:unnamed protein product [Urochloa decumbens]|uniref:Uncharacterized protein n=1 Tax=Urochloa decumbens TaxID=240449 RepID=A0ABC9FVJ0_9POAL
MDAVLAAVAAAALNQHRNPPMMRDLDLDPAGRHVAQRLRVCSVAYMALGVSLLIAGDHDHDQILVGFMSWMAGTTLLLLSSATTRVPVVAVVAAGVAQSVLEELALATILALAHRLLRLQPL